MNIEQANGIAMSEILEKIGHPPVKQTASDTWYHSPFRADKTASFHVNTAKNVWYDFGEAKGGDVINFVRTYLEGNGEDHTAVDALRWLRNMMLWPSSSLFVSGETLVEASAALVLQKRYDIKHRGLIHYLEARGIPLSLAKRYLKEVLIQNTNTQRRFCALSLRNESNGYELRNKFFKGCIAPKSISFIRGLKTPAVEIHVFEGFMDFLSALAQQKRNHLEGDVIVLNSVVCLPQVIPYIKNYTYKTLYSWLDNDIAGVKASQTLKEYVEKEANFSFQAMNSVYTPHKDVNAWHVHHLG